MIRLIAAKHSSIGFALSITYSPPGGRYLLSDNALKHAPENETIHATVDFSAVPDAAASMLPHRYNPEKSETLCSA